MRANLDPASAALLAKVCGMFGSTHDGERAAAALQADRRVRALGITWADVFEAVAKASPAQRPDAPPRSGRAGIRTPQVLARDMLRHRYDELTPWEVSFVESIVGWQGSVSPKQRATLGEIVDRLMAEAA